MSKARTLTRSVTLLAVAGLAVGVLVTGARAGEGPDLPTTPVTPTPTSPTSPTSVGRPAPAGAVAFADEGVRVDRRTTITLTVPAAVDTSSRFTVSGAVVVARRHPARRPIRLQERAGRRWHVVAARRSTARGGFTFRVPAGQEPRTRTFRVVAPARAHLARQATAPVRTRVTTDAAPDSPTPTTAAPTPTPTGDWDPAEYAAPGDPAPVGSATDWTWLATGGARWDPCTTIRWVYNPTGGYAGSLDDVRRAIARVAGRSGLHFRYVGATGFVPWAGVDPMPSGADLAVAWADEATVPGLKGGVVGLGGGTFVTLSGAHDVAARIVTGRVVLDTAGSLRHGFAASGNPTWGQVMEHEVMHAVGLGHAAGGEQVMASGVSALNHYFGNGDLAGLGRAGAANGCLS